MTLNKQRLYLKALKTSPTPQTSKSSPISIQQLWWINKHDTIFQAEAEMRQRLDGEVEQIWNTQTLTHARAHWPFCCLKDCMDPEWCTMMIPDRDPGVQQKMKAGDMGKRGAMAPLFLLRSPAPVYPRAPTAGAVVMVTGAKKDVPTPLRSSTRLRRVHSRDARPCARSNGWTRALHMRQRGCLFSAALSDWRNLNLHVYFASTHSCICYNPRKLIFWENKSLLR